MEESFVQHLVSNYHHYCMHQRIPPSTQDFIKYLIVHNVIEKVVIRHYVILEEFHRLSGEGKFSKKGELVKYLSEKYELHQSSVWLILKEHLQRFHPENKTPYST